MQIELTSPACLLLGLARFDGRTCQLGIALQYPQIQLVARSSSALVITGARADLAHRQGARFLEQQRLPPHAEVEVELAIPQFMGLGSAAMLGLSMAQALAGLYALPEGDAAELARAAGLAGDPSSGSPSINSGTGQAAALEMYAFAQGGLLLVGADGALLRRQTIAHDDEADDWVFVFVLPRPPRDTPETLEEDRRAALHEAAQYLDEQAGSAIAAELWAAVERNDIAAFAQALASLQALNHAALARGGQPVALTTQEQALIDIMRDGGALVCGRALTGLALYGLIEGGGPSRDLRRALASHLGIFGGTVMATLCDNVGARQQITK